MSGQQKINPAGLNREAILKAFNEMSDELGQRDAMTYHPKDKIPVKAQYLVEGLFAEGKI